jgi:hypothetical protein
MRKLLNVLLCVGLSVTACFPSGQLEDGAIDENELTTALVPTGSTWRYLDNGTNQGTAWRARGFDDSAWKSGAAELGYGDGDEKTVVSFGPSSSRKYVTTYFRKAFNVSDPAALRNVTLRIRRDDGAVVYVNGTEVYRTSLPSGTIGYDTLAIYSSDETTYFTATIANSVLVAGNNVVAVEVHQASVSSSDLSFNFALLAKSVTTTCTPTTCSAQGKTCGSISDGCGGALNCGSCTSPQTCGGGGVANVCGETSSCTPTTCAAQGKNCGNLSDGCGGTLNCGGCPSPQTCGGGGVANVCGGGSCTPTTCAAQGKNCGALSDGCGGTLNCGGCTSPQTCGGGGVANVCGGGGTVTALPSCLGGSGTQYVLSGAQTTKWDHRNEPASTKVDATTASWSSQINYPALFGGGGNQCWHGGKIVGTWAESVPWDTMHGAVALNLFSGPDTIVEQVFINNYGDGLRFEKSAENFLVRDVHVKHSRDDCIENDFVRNGKVQNSFFDGCYSGISAEPGSSNLSGLTDGRTKVFTIENTLLWLEPMQEVYSGPSPNTSGFFKWDGTSYDTSPKLVLRNNIFRADMIPDDNDLCLNPEGKTIESSGNIVVWLGQGPYPCLPIPPGWTLTTDKSVWDNAVAQWKAAHPGL